MNEQLQLARRYVYQTGVSLFLTGKAGTGKTTFLRDIDLHCPKRHVVVAPTGVAAVNACGVTIHSFFQLPFDPYLPEVKELVTEYQMQNSHKALNKNKLNIIRTLELLIIDEISMVRADLLDAIDMTLRRVRRSSRPFGGVQLLMIGDVHQLPPVVTDSERPYLDRVYPSPFFFHSKALQQLPYVTIELTTVYRQQDQAFVSLLNRVRDNRLDADTLRVLNSRVESQVAPSSSASVPITLTTHNQQADAINRSHMMALRGESRVLEADIAGNYPDSAMPVDKRLEVKVGERVMFLKNDSTGQHRYYNGKLGTVKTFGTDDEDRLTVVVECDDGDTVGVGREVWENVRYTLDPVSHQIKQEVDGTFRQYPLRPAWAVTIHKAQGLTFDRVRVNAADAFAFGQVYVALSRCRSMEGLVLTAPLTDGVAFDDADVARFVDSRPTFRQAADAVSDAERQYYYDQLLELFDVEAILADMDRLEEAYGKLRSLYPQKVEAMGRLRQSVADLASVGGRFKNQLLRLPTEQHADRISKGSAYYIGQLSALQAALEVEVEVDNKQLAARIRESVEAVKERVGVKLACLKVVSDKGFSVTAVQRAKTDHLLEVEQPKPKSRPRGAKTHKDSFALDEAEPLLVQLIARWRREKSAELGVPAFTIMHQKTLMALASAMPRSMAELLRVPGIGKAKAARYGEELLGLVADFCEQQGIPSIR